MRLTRKQSIALSLGLVAIFFVGSMILLSAKKPTPKPKQTTAEKIASAVQGTELMMGEFHRSETKNGKKLWEVKSPKGTYSVADQKAKLKTPQIWYYKDDGKIITLTAKQALIYFDKIRLTRAELKGGVTVKMDDITVTTPRAVFNNEKQTVTSPKNVKIEKDGAFISGDGFVADIEKQNFTLKKNVVTKLTKDLQNMGKEHEK